MSWRPICLTAAILIGLTASAPVAAPMFHGFEIEGTPDLRPAEANGRTSARPAIVAAPLNGAPLTVDGKLDDPAWLTAPAGTGFKVWDPNRGAIPTEETVFKVLYDQDAVYFGVACLESDPARVSAKLSRRDRFSNSDLVSVYIDPYHDQTTGYNFKVNPHGVQMDSYVYNDGDQDHGLGRGLAGGDLARRGRLVRRDPDPLLRDPLPPGRGDDLGAASLPLHARPGRGHGLGHLGPLDPPGSSAASATSGPARRPAAAPARDPPVRVGRETDPSIGPKPPGSPGPVTRSTATATSAPTSSTASPPT